MTPSQQVRPKDDEREYVMDAAAALESCDRRELWQPDRHEQMAACETLLSSPIPREVRLHVRDLYEDLKRAA